VTSPTDTQALVERLDERLKLKYITSTKAGPEQSVPLDLLHEILDLIDSQSAEISAVKAKLAEAMETLRPFADDLSNFTRPEDDNWLDGTPYVKRSELKTSHLRAARRLVEESNNG